MNDNQHKQDPHLRNPPGDRDGKLERLVRQIDPPSREVDGDDLSNPGRMTPASPPTDNRS